MSISPSFGVKEYTWIIPLRERSGLGLGEDPVGGGEGKGWRWMGEVVSMGETARLEVRESKLKKEDSAVRGRC